MAKVMKRPAATRKSPSNAFQPDPRREVVFEMYRDLGPGRSFRKLQEAVAVRWPANPLSLGALGSWSKKFDWAKRIAEFERGLTQGQAAPNPIQLLDTGDDVETLEKAASQALARVLVGMSVAITKPGDVKALVDTASKALELADKLKGERQGTSTPEEIAAFGAKLLDRIVEARRKDIVTMVKAAVEAACEEAGTANLLPVLKKAAAAVGLRVNDKGEIDNGDLAVPVAVESEVDVDGAGGGNGESGARPIGSNLDKLDTTTDEEISHQIAEDPDTAPIITDEMLNNSVIHKDCIDTDELLRKLRGED